MLLIKSILRINAHLYTLFRKLSVPLKARRGASITLANEIIGFQCQGFVDHNAHIIVDVVANTTHSQEYRIIFDAKLLPIAAYRRHYYGGAEIKRDLVPQERWASPYYKAIS